MNNAVYRNTMENLINRINVKFVQNEKYDLKFTSEPSFMSYKIFANNLAVICKSKVTLKLKRHAYIECIFWN